VPKKSSAKPKKKPAAATKPAPKKAAAPKAAVAFKDVRFAQDIIGRKVRMCPLSLKESFEVKVINVDLNAGVYIVNVRGKQGTFIYPMDQTAIQVA